MLERAPKAADENCANEPPSNGIQSRGLALQLGFSPQNGVEAEAEKQN